jgi:hypothetical protein
MWTWLRGLVGEKREAATLTRKQFEQRVLRQLARGGDRAGALLLGQGRLQLDPALLSAGGTSGQTAQRVHDLVDVIAPGCLLTIAAPDALLVFVQDLTRGIDVAEAIRMVVQQAFDRENVGGFEIDGAWTSSWLQEHPLLTGTVGACRGAPRHGLNDAIRQAEDNMMLARHSGGDRVLWNAVV